MMATSMNDDVPAESQVSKVGKIGYFENKELGSGGYGIVYEGLLNNKKVAVKKIPLEDCKKIQEKLMTISHRNIIRYLDIVKDEAYAFIAMELCAGNLEEFIKKKYEEKDPVLMKKLLRPIALGLKFLHDNRIIHQNITPKNILVSMTSSKDGEKPVLKLAGFSQCKQGTDGVSSFSNRDYGMPDGWAAPEMAMTDNVKRISFSADIFSLGCVFGYALTGGCHPFGDKTHSRASNVMTGSINWPNQHLIKNEELKKFIRRMISHNPNQRPSLSTVIDQLSAYLQKKKEKLLELCWSLNCVSHFDANRQRKLFKRLENFILREFDLNFVDSYGRNVLMMLFQDEIEGCREVGQRTCGLRRQCVEKLLSDAAIPLININHIDGKGENALHYLCRDYKGDYVIHFAELMILRGIYVNEKSKINEWTPLFYACSSERRNSSELIKLLIKHGAKVDSRTQHKDTPLHCLVKNYKGADIRDIIRLLIEAGADVNAKNRSQENALLSNSSHPELETAITVLIQSGVNVNDVDKHCIPSLLKNAVIFLTEKGIDAGAKDTDGYDAFYYVRNCNLEQKLLNDIEHKIYSSIQRKLITNYHLSRCNK